MKAVVSLAESDITQGISRATRRMLGFGIGLTLPLWLCAAQAPNVILIMTDDQGYGDMSCHGNPYIETPHLDKLHSESVRLTNFHVSPSCAPTRAALMTGRDTNKTGAWHTINGRNLMFLDEVIMAEVFAANGYRTN